MGIEGEEENTGRNMGETQERLENTEKSSLSKLALRLHFKIHLFVPLFPKISI